MLTGKTLGQFVSTLFRESGFSINQFVNLRRFTYHATSGFFPSNGYVLAPSSSYFLLWMTCIAEGFGTNTQAVSDLLQTRMSVTHNGRPLINGEPIDRSPGTPPQNLYFLDGFSSVNSLPDAATPANNRVIASTNFPIFQLINGGNLQIATIPDSALLNQWTYHGHIAAIALKESY